LLLPSGCFGWDMHTGNMESFDAALPYPVSPCLVAFPTFATDNEINRLAADRGNG